jgi:hypothetical protein
MLPRCSRDQAGHVWCRHGRVVRLVRDLGGVVVVSGGNVLGKLKLPVVFPLKDCFCFYLDVFTEN